MHSNNTRIETNDQDIMPELIAKFRLYFPDIATNVKTYLMQSPCDLTVILNNGDYILYDDYDRSIRNIPNPDDIDDKILKKEFGYALRKTMERKGINQNALSMKADIDQPTISRYVTGKSIPNLYSARKIAKALDCSIDDFIYF